MKKKKLKASVLLVSLLVLSVIVIIALSLSLTSIREEKSAVGESASAKAFQAADAGVEAVMHNLLRMGHTSVNQVMHGNCGADGVIKKDNYAVQLYDATGNKISCNSSALITTVASMKSVGTAMGQSRAIEANVQIP